MFRLRHRVALFALLIALSSPSSTADQLTINLIVKGAKPNVGSIMASLFDSPQAYMREPLVESSAVVDASGNASIDFGKHEPGEYAIAVIYDENENGKLDTGLFRIPKEKIGFSNNAKGRFGPAKWGNARFMLLDSDLLISIELKEAKAD